MEKIDFQFYKQLLLKEKNRIMNSGILASNEDLTVSPDDLADEADLAGQVINQQVTFNIRNRELSKLRSIDEALDRIKEGSFGCCEDCGEVIGKKRLDHQPWATLCITHAEEKERESSKFYNIG